jgi:predicted nicotinamide N-methyase
MNTTRMLIATDGDDDTMDLLKGNIKLSNCADDSITPLKLYWGESESEAFKLLYPDCFDILIAADVVYEREQIVPLILTSCKILKKGM